MFLGLAAPIFLPPFFYVTFGLSSMTVGFSIAMMALGLFFYETPLIVRLRNVRPLAILLIFLLASHATYFLLVDYDMRKLLVVFLSLMTLTIAGIFSNVVYKCNGRILLRCFKSLAVIGLLIGFGSFIIDANFLNYEKYHKSMFPFSEPSHYVLGFSSVFLVTGVFLGKAQRILLLSAIILLGVLKPSVALLVVAFVMIVVYYILPLKLEKIAVFAVLFVVAIQALSLVDSSKLTYFYERIPFTENIDSPIIQGGPNTSALVYMQGWEVVSDSMADTTGLGVGLYNMEKTVPGYYGEMLFGKLGRYQNRAEGSFLASKLITEFGIVGILVLAAYCSILVKSLWFFYRLSRNSENQNRAQRPKYPTSLIYAHSVIVVFVVEAFVRGIGYFSTGVFLLLVALFIMQRFRIDSLRRRVRQLYGYRSLARLTG